MLFFFYLKKERKLVSYAKKKHFRESFPYRPSSSRTSAEIRSVLIRARVLILSEIGGHFYIHFFLALQQSATIRNVFLHVFARNSNQELMKASIAAGKNH